MTAQKATTPAKTTAPKKAAGKAGFTADEKAAMQERAAELKSQSRRGGKADGEQDVRAKIAEMSSDDRALAERVHAIVREAAPSLAPKTWYGMPAYAREGKVVCFFQAAGKFKSRYATLGFSDEARLDDGAWWPTAFALTQLTPAIEKEIRALVVRAAGI